MLKDMSGKAKINNFGALLCIFVSLQSMKLFILLERILPESIIHVTQGKGNQTTVIGILMQTSLSEPSKLRKVQKGVNGWVRTSKCFL